MFKQILVPVDLTDPELAKPALATAVMMVAQSGGTIRLINIMPLTPVMLAEYVPPDCATIITAVASAGLASSGSVTVSYTHLTLPTKRIV